MVKTRIPRTPITDVRKARGRSGRAEIISAASEDGTWTYDREDDTRTLWVVTHVPTGRWLYMSSLPKARAATANGSALRQLDAQDADKQRQPLEEDR